MRMSGLEEKLRQKSLKITPQRLEVLRAINGAHDHPTAEMIFQRVKRRYPAVSLATVYKTLETLVEIGEIRVALVSHGKTRFDPRLDRHHHFVCCQCESVEDVASNLNCLESCFPEKLDQSYQVHRSEVVFHGVCPRCREKSVAAVPTVQPTVQ